MIKATAKEKTEAAVHLPKDITEATPYLKFPYDETAARHIRAITDLQGNIHRYENQLEKLKFEVAEYEAALKNTKERLDGLKASTPPNAVATQEEGRKAIEELLKLAWIEDVTLKGRTLTVITRRDSLITTLDKRYVRFNADSSPDFHLEMMDPVKVPLPKYKIKLNLDAVGQLFSNNDSLLSIGIIYPKDWVADLTHKDVWGHTTRPHWASNGTHLCLGEYQASLENALKQGLKPFFTELAMYLQMAEDASAYERKQDWMGKLRMVEYSRHLIRENAPNETGSGIDAKYKIDFKNRNQPENPVAAPIPAQDRRMTGVDMARDFFGSQFHHSPIFVSNGTIGGIGMSPELTTRSNALEAEIRRTRNIISGQGQEVAPVALEEVPEDADDDFNFDLDDIDDPLS